MKISEFVSFVSDVCQERGYPLRKVVDTKKSLETYGSDSPLILMFPPSKRISRQTGRQEIYVTMQFLTQSSLQNDSEHHFSQLEIIESLADSILVSIYESENIEALPDGEQWSILINQNSLVATGYEIKFGLQFLDC